MIIFKLFSFLRLWLAIEIRYIWQYRNHIKNLSISLMTNKSFILHHKLKEAFFISTLKIREVVKNIFKKKSNSKKFFFLSRSLTYFDDADEKLYFDAVTSLVTSKYSTEKKHEKQRLATILKLCVICNLAENNGPMDARDGTL